MRGKRFVFGVGAALSVCYLVLASPGGQEALPPPDAAVAQMIAEVAKDRLAETTARLAGVRTRFSPTSGCRAAGTSIYNFLTRLGLAVEYDVFRYTLPRLFQGGGEGRNVVATLPGTAASGAILVVGAHYDSFSTEEFRAAPGADDDASGIAAVLEIARVLSRHRFSRTIRFVAFDAEELGTFGSEHLAVAAKSRREAIVAMLNLDMVGFSHGGKGALAVVPEPADQWLADRFIQETRRFGIPIRVVKRVNARWARSDQASFLAAGYPALAISEDAPDDNPHYHSPSDTADTLDMDFLTAVTRATLATLATLAGPQPLPSPPVTTGAPTGAPPAAEARPLPDNRPATEAQPNLNTAPAVPCSLIRYSGLLASTPEAVAQEVLLTLESCDSVTGEFSGIVRWTQVGSASFMPVRGRLTVTALSFTGTGGSASFAWKDGAWQGAWQPTSGSARRLALSEIRTPQQRSRE